MKEDLGVRENNMNYNMRYSVERDYKAVIKRLEELPHDARVIDIGGGYNPWGKKYVTHYVDLYKK